MSLSDKKGAHVPRGSALSTPQILAGWSQGDENGGSYSGRGFGERACLLWPCDAPSCAVKAMPHALMLTRHFFVHLHSSYCKHSFQSTQLDPRVTLIDHSP